MFGNFGLMVVAKRLALDGGSDHGGALKGLAGHGFDGACGR